MDDADEPARQTNNLQRIVDRAIEVFRCRIYVTHKRNDHAMERAWGHPLQLVENSIFYEVFMRHEWTTRIVCKTSDGVVFDYTTSVIHIMTTKEGKRIAKRPLDVIKGLSEGSNFKKTENLCAAMSRNGLNKKMKFVG